VVVERGDVARAKPEPDSSSSARSAWARKSKTAAWSATRSARSAPQEGA
jgi:hypothetical protein